MTDDTLRQAYASGMTRSSDRSGCPTPEAIEAVVTRSGSEESRLATLDHVMGCASCKADFDLMQSFAVPRAPSRRFTFPLAAAATIGLVVAGSLLYQVMRSRKGPDQTLRGGETAIVLVAPNGDRVGQPVSFIWRAVPAATRYTLEVFNAAGDAVYTTDVSDTTAVMPLTVQLAVGETYHWWLTVRKSDGTESRSQPQRFTP